MGPTMGGGSQDRKKRINARDNDVQGKSARGQGRRMLQGETAGLVWVPWIPWDLFAYSEKMGEVPGLGGHWEV